MSDLVIESNSEEETINFAREFSQGLCAGDIVLLHGDLGMGKSVFARSCIRFLCGNVGLEVPSPTFTLVQMYDADLGTVWHFDLYRLSDVSEIYEIGWEEALSSKGIIFVEWSERLGNLMPPLYIDVTLSPISGAVGKRKIEVARHG